jgi:hypothetical protein
MFYGCPIEANHKPPPPLPAAGASGVSGASCGSASTSPLFATNHTVGEFSRSAPGLSRINNIHGFSGFNANGNSFSATAAGFGAETFSSILGAAQGARALGTFADASITDAFNKELSKWEDGLVAPHIDDISTENRVDSTSPAPVTVTSPVTVFVSRCFTSCFGICICVYVCLSSLRNISRFDVCVVVLT